LVVALRAGDGNTELIAQRARHLLRCKPSGVERDAWLRTVLPQQGDAGKALKALRTVNGGGTPAKATTSGNGQSVTTDGENGSGQRQQRPRRSRRRR
jgi:hypothetical protein